MTKSTRRKAAIRKLADELGVSYVTAMRIRDERSAQMPATPGINSEFITPITNEAETQRDWAASLMRDVKDDEHPTTRTHNPRPTHQFAPARRDARDAVASMSEPLGRVKEGDFRAGRPERLRVARGRLASHP